MTEGDTLVVEEHILVVEDNQLNAEILCYFLKDRGCTFEVVTNGVLAVEAFQKGEYDLILMDIMLPEMSGYEATEEIIKLAGDRKVPPIVGVTAKVFQDDYERCFQVGMCAVVHKPIDFDVLSSTLDTCLSGESSVEETVTDDVVEEFSYRTFDGKVAEAFVARMQGDDGDRTQVVDHVVNEFELGIERIADSIGTGNLDLIERNAHSLKGSLGLVGARDAFDLAKGMELSAASQGANFNPEHWLMLIRSAFESLRAELEEFRQR